MRLEVLSMTMTVVANIGYHLCQKAIAPNANPLLSLMIAYLTGLVLTLVALPFYPSSGSWLAQIKATNWATFGLGATIVIIELGFLLAYRAGWNLNAAALFSNAIVAVLLVPVGIAFYREEITVPKGIGIVLSLAGIALMSKK
jgi:drug/metabolite transporter (DMT)-like permease